MGITLLNIYKHLLFKNKIPLSITRISLPLKYLQKDLPTCLESQLQWPCSSLTPWASGSDPEELWRRHTPIPIPFLLFRLPSPSLIQEWQTRRQSNEKFSRDGFYWKTVHFVREGMGLLAQENGQDDSSRVRCYSQSTVKADLITTKSQAAYSPEALHHTLGMA